MTDTLIQYGSGIIGLMVLVIIINILGPLVGAKKASANIKPGSEPEGDYGDANYRLHRAHLNAVENFGTFGVTAIFAMLLGASAGWVNGLIWGTVVIRLVYTYVFLAGLGKASQGLRTMLYVLTWVLALIMVALVVMQVM